MKKWIILFCIVILASVLRLYHITSNPPSLDWDEASLGYNAYSILKTGRDEYGTKFPLTIRSFDDYKPPLYVYILIPFIAILDLNEFSVRLPSALFGIFAVLITYFLVKELFDEKTAMISSFLLAISPWHLQFSRAAFEANISLTCIIVGAFFFLYGIKRRFFFFLSVSFFILSLYAYHSARVFTPLLMMGLVVLYWREVFSDKVKVVVGILFASLLLLPLIITVFSSPQILLRAQGVSIYGNKTELLKKTAAYQLEDQKSGRLLGVVFHNRRFVYMLSFLDGYFSHWNLNWLFITGDNQRHHAPGMGLMYLVELPFLFGGIYSLFFKRSQERNVVFWWLIAAPVAAAPTTGVPHAIRSLTFLPMLQVCMAIGLITVFQQVKSHIRQPLQYGLFAVGIFLFSFNFLYYLDLYHIHMPLEYAPYWQYGYKEAVQWTENNRQQYQKIIISTKLDQPYIFFLFYSKYDPVKYLSQGGTGGNGLVKNFVAYDNFEFRKIEWEKEKKTQKKLFIGPPQDFPDGIKSIYEVSYPSRDIFAKFVSF